MEIKNIFHRMRRGNGNRRMYRAWYRGRILRYDYYWAEHNVRLDRRWKAECERMNGPKEER